MSVSALTRRTRALDGAAGDLHVDAAGRHGDEQDERRGGGKTGHVRGMTRSFHRGRARRLQSNHQERTESDEIVASFVFES
jgi:hypothetical protein